MEIRVINAINPGLSVFKVDDIANTRRIAAVIRGGRYLDRAELDGLLADLIERNGN